jgi:aspartate racemase
MVPEGDDIEIVNDVIYKELCLGIVNDESRAKYQKIIRKMKDKGAKGVILGCTEIGLLISQKDSVLPVFDTTLIHGQTAAKRSIGE